MGVLETLVIYSTVAMVSNTVIIFLNTKCLWKAMNEDA